MKLKLYCLAMLAPAAIMWGCIDPLYSPQVVNSPQITISGVTASYDKVIFTLTPVNAVSVTYAVLEGVTDEPSPEDYITVEATKPLTVTIPDLDLQVSYRIFAYSTSGIYEGETSIPAMTAFTTAPLVSLTPAGTERANCYIVPETGCYKFDATVKGNSAASVGTAAGAQVIWSDVAQLLGDVTLMEDGWVSFVARKGAGNAVVAVVDESDYVLWSWHIWCPNGTPADEEYTNYNSAKYTVMDRNLGAISASMGNTCMLYQWGRKDPFPNTHYVYLGERTTTDYMIREWEPVNWDKTEDAANNNLQFAVRNPAVFITGVNATDQRWFPTLDNDMLDLWGDRLGYAAGSQSANVWSSGKTIYDPCPAGYRVPNVYTISGFTSTGTSVTSGVPTGCNVVGSWSSGWKFKKNSTDAIGTWWPVTAWRDPANGGVAGGTRAVHWYSNPTGGTATKCRRSFIHETTVQTVTSSDALAYGYAVRCVKIPVQP